MGNYVPHVIEPSAGLDRLALAIIAAAYHEEEKADVNGKIEKRTVLRFHPRIAPVKVGVFPLLKNKPELVAKARAVFDALKRGTCQGRPRLAALLGWPLGIHAAVWLALGV